MYVCICLYVFVLMLKKLPVCCVCMQFAYINIYVNRHKINERFASGCLLFGQQSSILQMYAVKCTHLHIILIYKVHVCM